MGYTVWALRGVCAPRHVSAVTPLANAMIFAFSCIHINKMRRSGRAWSQTFYTWSVRPHDPWSYRLCPRRLERSCMAPKVQQPNSVSFHNTALPFPAEVTTPLWDLELLPGSEQMCAASSRRLASRSGSSAALELFMMSDMRLWPQAPRPQQSLTQFSCT